MMQKCWFSIWKPDFFLGRLLFSLLLSPDAFPCFFSLLFFTVINKELNKMAKVAVVVFHSGYGHTQRVAQFVAEGANAPS